MTEPEINQTAELLARLEPGFVPYPIFEQAMRIFAVPVFELIPLRLNKQGVVEVLLIDRGPNDPIWPNMLHTPGTIIRATDLTADTSANQLSMQRIMHDELQGTAISEPHFFGNMLHKSKRGVEQAQLYWAEVLGEPTVGAFYSTDQLPELLIDSQSDFIHQAADSFKAYATGAQAELL